MTPKCTAYRAYCREHGFTHGAEAEELRQGVEAIIAEFEGTQYSVDTMCSILRAMLARVDARDSLAFVELEQRRRKRANAKRRTAKASNK